MLQDYTSMLTRLRHYLETVLPFLKGRKLLLTVSGGVDSVVMASLFADLGYNIGIAHCNFGLRGAESDADTEFVRQLAESIGVEFYTVKFDTDLYASENKLSIQVAARKLRYLWFEEVRQKHDYDYVLTAHHLDDSLETFLINLSRGTGLEGLTGIPRRNGLIVRPMLPFSRKEIEAYALERGLAWREDSSNGTTKYLRNKIRHEIAPLLKELNGSFDDSFANTLQHLEQSKSLTDDAAAIVYREVVQEGFNEKTILLEQLRRLPNYRAYLYHWLAPLGFTAWEDIYALVNAQSGKAVFAPGYRLLKDRVVLVLSQLKDSAADKKYTIERDSEYLNEPIAMRFSVEKTVPEKLLKNVLHADKDTLKFPLFVRKWKPGDWFCPSGMNGRKKKVSKYFKDEKFSLAEKEQVWLLCSGEAIVWIIGHRADHRFIANKNTDTILKIELLQ